MFTLIKQVFIILLSFSSSLARDRTKCLSMIKVTTTKNVWFAIIDFLIMDSNSKILYAMAVMI